MSRQNKINVIINESEQNPIMQLYENILQHIANQIIDDPRVSAKEILTDLLEQRTSVREFARSALKQ